MNKAMIWGVKPHPSYHNSLDECLDEKIWKQTIDFFPLGVSIRF